MASGGGTAVLRALAVDEASVDISGGGEVTVAPTLTLPVSASGGGKVYHLGEPDLVRIDTNGGSAVQ